MSPHADAEHDFEDLYENAPCGYLSTRSDGTILQVNQTLLTWTGHERAALVGHMRFQQLLAPGDRIFYETHYAPLLRLQDAVREIAVDLVCADGRRLPVLLNSVRTASSVIRTCVFVARDRREYERELLRQRRRAEESESRSRTLAQTLQASFMPPLLPRIPGLDVAGVYRPAGHGAEVGGDFYDIFETGRGDWALVVGDVCGKGAAAAVVTSLVRHTVRAVSIRSRRPRTVLTTTNEVLRHNGRHRFCTVAYTRVRPRGDGVVRLCVTLGGHPAPIRLTAADGAVPVGRTGTMLGALPRPRLRETTTELRPGDAMLFYTDGVTEARRDREFFGEERLHALVAGLHGADAAGIAGRVIHEVLAFQNGLPRDDIVIVVLKAVGV